MRIGLFGFPLTGKSTLFRLLTGVAPPAHVVKGEFQVGVTKIPDPRLDNLVEMHTPKKITHATVEYIDLAGVKKGEAAEELPLQELRSVNALAHVVRGFRDEAVPHVEGAPDPARDVATMNTELILADHTIAERRVEKLEMAVMKAQKKEDKLELEVMRKCLSVLETDTPLREASWTDVEEKLLRGFTFLSFKPLLTVVNADEEDAAKIDVGAEAFGLADAGEVVALSAKIETEIAQLDPEDAAAFRADLGIGEPALDRMIRASHRLLDRISFFTCAEVECRQWTLRRGKTAREAAGTVHSDMERGFIRAEVVGYDEFVEAGGWHGAKEHGVFRLEGKDYVVKDGDVVHFRFAT